MSPTASAAVPAVSADVFAEIAELGAQLCGAQYAAVTLLEGGQHRALARHGGLPIVLLPRDSRFCSTAWRESRNERSPAVRKHHFPATWTRLTPRMA